MASICRSIRNARSRSRKTLNPNPKLTTTKWILGTSATSICPGTPSRRTPSSTIGWFPR